MTNAPTKPLNPWISILTMPRATIQQIVDTDPSKHLWLLAGLAALPFALHSVWGNVITAGIHQTGKSPFNAFAFILDMARLIVCIYYVQVFALYKTGQKIGGKASLAEIRASVYWSYLPLIYSMIILAPLAMGATYFIAEGEELIQKKTVVDAFLVDHTWMLVFPLIAAIVSGIFAVGSLVVGVKCLSQVQGFSARQAISNGALAGGLTIAASYFLKNIFSVFM